MIGLSVELQADENKAVDDFLFRLQEQGSLPLDDEWAQEFQTQFTELLSNSHVHPSVLPIIAKALENSSLTEAPGTGASIVFRIAQETDRLIKQGDNPLRVQNELRRQIERTKGQLLNKPVSPGARIKEKIKKAIQNRGKAKPDFAGPPGLDTGRTIPADQKPDSFPDRPSPDKPGAGGKPE